MNRVNQVVQHLLPQSNSNSNNNKNTTNKSQQSKFYVDFEQHKLKKLPSHYIIRSLELNDYNKNYIILLSQLSSAPNITQQQFTTTYNIQQSSYNTYHTVIIEDTHKQQCIATATLIIEYKYIRSCGIVGHIEDVVVDKSYRGYDLGLYVIYALINRCNDIGCYKIILDCETHNIPFYNKLGFIENAKHMALYLNQSI